MGQSYEIAALRISEHLTVCRCQQNVGVTVQIRDPFIQVHVISSEWKLWYYWCNTPVDHTCTTNFKVLWLFAKFSHRSLEAWHPLAAQWAAPLSNPQSFLREIPPICEVFSCKSFPVHVAHMCGEAFCMQCPFLKVLLKFPLPPLPSIRLLSLLTVPRLFFSLLPRVGLETQVPDSRHHPLHWHCVFSPSWRCQECWAVALEETAQILPQEWYEGMSD